MVQTENSKNGLEKGGRAFWAEEASCAWAQRKNSTCTFHSKLQGVGLSLGDHWAQEVDKGYVRHGL